MPLELPKAFVARMQEDLGPDYEAFVHALEGKPATSLRLNPGKPGAEFSDSSPIPWEKTGLYLPERPQFFKDPLIYGGSYYVQEASSMLIGAMADFSEDMRILDLCASPGGKSTLLASKMSPDSLLVSNELVGNRARILMENVSRWGQANVFVANNHPRDYPALREFFDLIVVDAPCSGEGMFRKDPKVIKTWKPSIVRQCAERQKAILNDVMHALRPGGRLIYSTCTYNPDENEDIVQWLLDVEPGLFEIVAHEFPAEWGLSPGKTDGYHPDMRFTYHCYPHQVNGEGFFLACLEKTSSNRSGPKSSSKSKHFGKKRKHKSGNEQQRRQAPRISKADFEMAKGYLKNADAFDLQAVEGEIRAIPDGHVDDFEVLQEKLRLIRTGIHLGQPSKGRLHPDHDFAMSEQTGDKFPVIEVDFKQAIRYLSRDEMQLETGDIRDWAIVRYSGRNLGWVKVLEKRVNNHLPKYLRIRTDLSELY